MAEHALPVLMYHGLHAGADARGVFDPVYSVDPRDFAQQLDWLAAHGYRTLRLRDLAAAPPPAQSIIITFDDGDVSNAEVALPLLRERGMLAEFFVTADYIGRSGRLAAADVRALAQAGMGVQSHGFSHSYLSELGAAELGAELRASKQRLEAITGEPVTALALPGGRGGERERMAALRLGYRDLLNSAPGRNRGWQCGRYLQRLAITRGLALDAFADLVQWRGVRPRTQRLRYHLLAGAKRLLGNPRYEQFRKRILQR